MKTKIGILTWYDPTNCGSALQAYALQEALCQQGYDATIIRYVAHWNRGDYMQMPFSIIPLRKKLKRLIKNSLLPFYRLLPRKVRRHVNPFYVFYHDVCKMTPPCTEENIVLTTKAFDIIITGSDQIWSPIAFDPVFMLNFCTNSEVKKISYAASIGYNEVDAQLLSQYKTLLSDYRHISVREQRGADILQSVGIQATVTLDPTFLLPVSHYEHLERKPNNAAEPFIFCYFLSTNLSYSSSIQEYAQRHNLSVYGFSHNAEDYDWMRDMRHIGPQEFLWLIHNAEIVFTNSYHATIFSLLFHKPFFTYLRFSEDNPICQNSRIEQLNTYFNISDHIIKGEVPDIGEYDYSAFEHRLSQLKQQSIQYLQNSINSTDYGRH